MTPAEIKKARQTLGLSGPQLAPLLGYSAAPRIYELENGTRQPGGAVVRLLQAYLDGYRPKDWPQSADAD